jgi:Tfp pilus assembly protein PilV
MKATYARLRLTSRVDSGFGVIEIVISMFLLGLLATALLPLLVQGLKQSASSATLATATQLANDQIEIVRAEKKCDGLVPLNNTVTDARNVSLLVSRTVSACTVPTKENPSKVTVSVTVKRVDTGVVLATASTLVFVSEW